MARPSCYQLVKMWHEMPAALTLEERAVCFGNAVADACLPPPSRRIELAELGLTMRAYGALRRSGYRFADEIQGMTHEQLVEIRGLGRISALDIADRLQDATKESEWSLSLSESEAGGNAAA